MSGHLVGAAEVAGILGISRQRVAQLATENLDFPAPEAVLSGGRIWSRHAIEGWAATHKDRGRLGKPRPPAPVDVYELPARLSQIQGLAIGQGRELHHSWIGPDHLLLALLHPKCPGAARQVLASFGVSLGDVRRALVESMGDPFESPSRVVKPLPDNYVVLERANLKAFELGDEEVTSQHVLLALTDRWGHTATTAYLTRCGVDPETVRERVIAITEKPREIPEPPPPPRQRYVAPRQIPRPPEPELAPTPAGRDPRRRRPWGSAVFHDGEGRPVTQGIALRQYFVDRDGNPVLTTDGRPVHVLIDEGGYMVMDEAGNAIIVAVDVPPGSVLKAAPED